MPIEIKLTGGKILESKGKRFHETRRELQSRLFEKTKKFAFSVVRRAQTNYLTGPRPKRLGVVTGRLRSNISAKVEKNNGETITATMGTNVVYGKVHEYGFKGTVNIPAFQRVISKVFGRPIQAKSIKVRAHTRKVDIPKRPFISPSIDDELPDYKNSIIRILREIPFMGKS